MKTHITNLYNFRKNDPLVERQHLFASVARTQGFLEMGIFEYPVATDSAVELSKRIDGIIASLQEGDVVFMQLPTKNGWDYEHLLHMKIKAYRNTKVVLLIHDMKMFLETDEETRVTYMEMCRNSELIICPEKKDEQYFRQNKIQNVTNYSRVVYAEKLIQEKESCLNNCENSECSNEFLNLCESDFCIRKLLNDAIDYLFERYFKKLSHVEKLQEDEVHIGFGLHDKTGKYSKWVGVAMQSIIDHTSSAVFFHILVDDTVSDEDKEKLLYIAERSGNRLAFHVVDTSKLENLSSLAGRFTIGSFFRALLPDILDGVKKIIYLDADIFVNRDIRELWDMEVENYCLLASMDNYRLLAFPNAPYLPVVVAKGLVKEEEYFNSGILYMNLDEIRKNGNLIQQMVDFLQKVPETSLPDQDALNVIYNTKKKLIDISWNYFTLLSRKENTQKMEKKIYHYAGDRLQISSGICVDWTYLGTLQRTPWGDEASHKIMRMSINRLNERIELLERIISKTSGKKTIKIFYGNETPSMRYLYDLLGVCSEDYRILEKPVFNSESILKCKGLDSLVDEKREYVVFVLPGADNGNAITNLEKIGLKRDEDYYVIPCLLSAKYGGYIDFSLSSI